MGGMEVKAKARRKPVSRRQRATEVTARKKALFLDALKANCGNVSRAAEVAGVSRVTVYRWRDRNPAVAEAWDNIVIETTEQAEQELYRRAVEGVNKPVFQGGKLVGHIREFSDTCLIFLLKARKPQMYRERASVEHSGPNGGAIQIDNPYAKLADGDLLTISRHLLALHDEAATT